VTRFRLTCWQPGKFTRMIDVIPIADVANSSRILETKLFYSSRILEFRCIMAVQSAFEYIALSHASHLLPGTYAESKGPN
jgi:hypothetical protein